MNTTPKLKVVGTDDATTPTNLDTALRLARVGLEVFPCDPAKKRPRTKGDWRNAATSDEATIRGWWRAWPDALPGLDCGAARLFVVDLDCPNEDKPNRADGVKAFSEFGSAGLETTPVVNTPSGGRHLYFRQPLERTLTNGTGKKMPKGVDCRGEGGYVIAPGAALPDGRSYGPLDPRLLVSDALLGPPEWLLDLLPPVEPEPTPAPPQTVTEHEREFAKTKLEKSARELASAVENRNTQLNSAAYYLGRMGGAGWIDRGEVEEALLRACEENGLAVEDGPRKCQQSFKSGWRAGERRPRRPLRVAPRFSEEDLALRLAERHGEELRYVSKWGWWAYDKGRWCEDKRRHVFNCARALCREAAQEVLALIAAGEKPHAKPGALATAKTRAAVVSLAGDDRALVAVPEDFDADPWLLNTPAGVLNLRDGTTRPHSPADYMTKMTAVAPDPTLPTPLWEAFLARVTNNDVELVAYLQRLCGYALTGVVREHVLAFLYGSGANGKSTFLTVLTDVLADYHKSVPVSTLMASRNEQHPTDVAGLVGARLATANETGQGKNWDEPKIKQLTGGDKVTARFMRQDFFEFTPQFKLVISGNHKPGLRDVDESIRRRLHLVPFTVTIPEDERDPELVTKLRAEAPGVLHWIVQGCLEWQRSGLRPPAAVTEATNEYLEAQDLVGEFLTERCEVDKTADAQSAGLFASWKEFAEGRGEFAGKQTAFNDRLEKRGFRKFADKAGKKFKGLRLVVKSQADAAEATYSAARSLAKVEGGADARATLTLLRTAAGDAKPAGEA